jgi:antitoxin YefM
MLLTKRTDLRTISAEIKMSVIKATDARSKLYRLIDEVSSSHNPITITGKRGNAVLLSEEDWKAIQETLYLLSIPGMRESIRTGLETPVEECAEDLDW